MDEGHAFRLVGEREAAPAAGLGDRIRRQRLAQNWTQAEVARRCDLHRTFIGSVERGERNIGLDNIHALADALDVPVSDFFTDGGAP